MSDPLKYGDAGGWVVHPEGEGFAWHAWWGHGRSDSGHAATREVANALASMALERLRETKLRLVE